MRTAVGPQIPRRVVHNHLHSTLERHREIGPAISWCSYDAALVVGAPDAHAVRAPKPAEDDLHHTDTSSHSQEETLFTPHPVHHDPESQELV